jgi:hypothetical protein
MTEQSETVVNRVRSVAGTLLGVLAGFVLGIMVSIYIPGIVEYPGLVSWLAVKGIGAHLLVALGLWVAGGVVKPAGGSSV